MIELVLWVETYEKFPILFNGWGLHVCSMDGTKGGHWPYKCCLVGQWVSNYSFQSYSYFQLVMMNHPSMLVGPWSFCTWIWTIWITHAVFLSFCIQWSNFCVHVFIRILCDIWSEWQTETKTNTKKRVWYCDVRVVFALVVFTFI